MAFHTSTGLIGQPYLPRPGAARHARILVSWLVFWIIVLPLVHVHIQAERHQGLPHNVLAGDLPGEFVSSADSAIETAQPSGTPTPPHLASGLSYPELAFTAPVPSKHHWLFPLTALPTYEAAGDFSTAGRTLAPALLTSDGSSPPNPSSPRAPPSLERLA